MTEATIVRVERLDFRLANWQWPFGRERATEIENNFSLLKSNKPAIWNGRVFILRDYSISGTVLSGNFFETGFAELLAWRDWGYPDESIRSCFAMAAVESIDKGFLLGVMGDHTANSGKIYFPTGTPDASDLYGNRVDLDKSVRRELKEETGLAFEEFQLEPGWYAVFSGHHIALIKHLRSRLTGAELRSRALSFLEKDEQPEFSDIRIFHAPSDLSANVPAYVQAFLKQIWRDGGVTRA